MKKIINLFVLTMISVFNFTQSFDAQQTSKDNFTKAFEVRLNKSNYILFEPIFAKFKCTLPSTDGIPSILQDSIIKITFEDKTKELSRITSSMGGVQALPEKDNSFRYITYEKETSIEGVETLFPEPGKYQIQFVLFGVESNTIDITIEEPKGIDKDAFDFLKKYKNPLSFEWIYKEKNGIAILESFVNRYGESVYGEIAIYRLGLNYFYKGEFEKAKVQLEKLISSKNEGIVKDAKSSLRDVEENIKDKEAEKADLEKMKKPQ